MSTQVGKAFHSFNSKGVLLRRGLVLKEYPRSVVVCFCDPLSGVLTEQRRVSKSKTTHWQWFASVDEANHAYRKHFNEDAG